MTIHLGSLVTSAERLDTLLKNKADEAAQAKDYQKNLYFRISRTCWCCLGAKGIGRVKQSRANQAKLYFIPKIANCLSKCIATIMCKRARDPQDTARIAPARAITIIPAPQRMN